eukprot:2490413-Rhodomonas_salina.3
MEHVRRVEEKGRNEAQAGTEEEKRRDRVGMVLAQREEEKGRDGARVERGERGRDEALAGRGREGGCKEWGARGEKERWEAMGHALREGEKGGMYGACKERGREGKGKGRC